MTLVAQTELVRELSGELRSDQIIEEEAGRRAYESDGLTSHRATPLLAVLPESARQVQAVVETCARHGIPFVARGSGTGLSGGATPNSDGVLVVLSRMRRIIDIDPVNQRMAVEPGVTNLEVSEAAAPYGLYYAPDPSSQVVCTIGGNVSENAGGAHCLKYGFTTHHVLAMEVVLPDGRLTELGSSTIEGPGYDLRGLFIGAEGTLGIATRITVRLLPRPESRETLVAEFSSPEQAGEVVSAVIAAGIVPAAVEMLDNLAIQACEVAVGAGFSLSAGAALIIEVDGPVEECAASLAAVQRICASVPATRLRIARDESERSLIWRGRKSAFAAMGRISPSYLIQDGVIPRTMLGPVLREISLLSSEAGLRVANVFHAGDGNLHPLVLYRAADEDEARRAEELSARILEVCVSAGGSITGEHGVGLDKACAMPLMFSAADLELMKQVRSAFDPHGLCNPDKVFPTPRLCGETPGPYRRHPVESAGLAERW